MWNPNHYETTQIPARNVRVGDIVVINGDTADRVETIRAAAVRGGIWIKGGGQTRRFDDNTPVTKLVRDSGGRIIRKG